MPEAYIVSKILVNMKTPALLSQGFRKFLGNWGIGPTKFLKELHHYQLNCCRKLWSRSDKEIEMIVTVFQRAENLKGFRTFNSVF